MTDVRCNNIDCKWCHFGRCEADGIQISWASECETCEDYDEEDDEDE